MGAGDDTFVWDPGDGSDTINTAWLSIAWLIFVVGEQSSRPTSPSTTRRS